MRTLMKCTPRELQVPYTNENHSHMEVLVLSYFDWNVFTPTANSFVESLLPQAIDSSDHHILSNGDQVPIGPNLQETRSKLVAALKALLKISLQVILHKIYISFSWSTSTLKINKRSGSLELIMFEFL